MTDDAILDDPRINDFLVTFNQILHFIHQAGEKAETDTAHPILADVVEEHLGVPPGSVAVVTEHVSRLRATDFDVALSAVIDRHGGGRLVGVSGGDQRMHNSFSEMVQLGWRQFRTGAVDYDRAAIGPDEQRRVVTFGLHLFRYAGHPVAVMQRSASPRFGQEGVLEVICPDEDATMALLQEVRQASQTHSVLRGKVLTFTATDFGGESDGGVTFVRREPVAPEDVILPPGVLDRIDRQVTGVAIHRDALRNAGQHLKRGVLLYGPPGTGKTHTVRYLIGQSPDTTVILLAGNNLRLVRAAAEVARMMQPAMIVLEDCDLIAEERSMHDGPQPLLFEVLDAMDGLSGDADVAFVLTTNRADLLEKALAQRPGRVDLAVEIPLPDLPARERLFALYTGSLGFSAPAVQRAASLSAGVTASFVKEAARRAVLRAAVAGRSVADADLIAAVEEMTGDSERITRSLLGAGSLRDDDTGPYA